MVTHLRDIGLIVSEMPSDGLADSVFVEDTVVLVGNTAMITVPGATSRRPETERVKQTLEELSNGSLKIVH
jgi:dimethylargininase